MSKIQMKSCVVFGDMSSDSTSEQYPEEPVCTTCIAEQEAKRENSRIVSVGALVTDNRAVCVFCDSSFDD